VSKNNAVPNRLINEKSPYLLQHAYNPVDWYPWGEEAIQKAKSEDKPIFLSIGYSTCHWCHVMERESFEDQEVADLLNRYFISIKVDREERPDLDHMYMTYCQAMTGSGGWPLTVILTPDKKPFFAGTYFPKESDFGRPGLVEILNSIAMLWQKEKDKVKENADELYQAVAERYVLQKKDPVFETIPAPANLKKGVDSIARWGPDVVKKAYTLLQQSFDPQYGGFGRAPKFPAPHNLGFLLRYAFLEPQSQALEMVKKTLDSMADGGIWDHIGFGFARYSTDRYWLVPHFEKMLYDNAGLALVHLEAYQLTKEERYARISLDTLRYVLRDMTSPEGGFYSAEDADSEGIEGKFYVWSKTEIEEILRKGLPDAVLSGENRDREISNIDSALSKLKGQEQLANLYCEAYGITSQGNFEGKNIPNKINSDWERIAAAYKLTKEELEQLLQVCNRVLFAEREKRIKPAKDDKILTAWNGLMIAALAKGAQTFTKQDVAPGVRMELLPAAEKAANFIRSNLIDSSGRLLANYRDGEAGYPGYLDDYAFFIYGLLELYTACGIPEYLKLAVDLQEEQERLFSDDISGGYYFTGNDAEKLLFRPQEIYDGAMPSGNSISFYNLARLWRLTGEQKYQERAAKLGDFFRPSLEDYPPGYTAALQALQFYLGPVDELVLSGPLTGKTNDMQAVIFEDFRPFLVVAYNEGTLEKFIPKFAGYPIAEKVAAYLCRDFACQEPVDSPQKLKELLDR